MVGFQIAKHRFDGSFLIDDLGLFRKGKQHWREDLETGLKSFGAALFKACQGFLSGWETGAR